MPARLVEALPFDMFTADSGPDLGIADAYGTAAFVMGVDSLDWIRTQPGSHAYLITHDGNTCWSEGFPHHAPVKCAV